MNEEEIKTLLKNYDITDGENNGWYYLHNDYKNDNADRMRIGRIICDLDNNADGNTIEIYYFNGYDDYNYTGHLNKLEELYKDSGYNYEISISQDTYGDINAENISQRLNSNDSINSVNAVYAGHSDGHFGAAKSLASNLEYYDQKGLEYKTPTYLVNVDGVCTELNKGEGTAKLAGWYKKIGEHNIPYTYVSSCAKSDDYEKQRGLADIKLASQNGVQTYKIVTTTETIHGNMGDYVMKSGLYEQLSGTGTIDKNKYKDGVIRYYLDGDELKTQDLNMDQYLFQSKKEATGAFKVNNMSLLDLETLNKEMETGVYTTGTLNQLDFDISKLILSDATATVESSLSQVLAGVAEIKGKCLDAKNAASDLNSISFKSTTETPVLEPEIVVDFLNLTANIFDKFSADAQMIADSAQDLDTIDKLLSTEAYDLGNIIVASSSSMPKVEYTYVNPEEGTDSDLLGNGSQSETVDTTTIDSQTGAKGTGGGSNSGGGASGGGGYSGGTDQDYEDEKARQEEEKKKAEEAKKKQEEEQKLKEEEEKKKQEEEQKLKEEEEKKKQEEQKLKEEEEKKKQEDQQKLEEERKKIEEERKKLEEEKKKLEKEKKKTSGGSTSNGNSGKTQKNVNKTVKNKEGNVIDIIDSNKETDVTPIEPVIEPVDDPVIEPIIEPIIEIDEPIIEPIDTPIVNDNGNGSNVKKNNAGKAIGIAAGIGLAVGAAAYGAHEYQKSKESDDESYE